MSTFWTIFSVFAALWAFGLLIVGGWKKDFSMMSFGGVLLLLIEHGLR